jgi:ferritin
MISKKIEKLINDQFNMELYSSNSYLSMTSYFLSIDLEGFANYFRIQAQEEMMHAMKQFDYMHEVDGKIEMLTVVAPNIKFKSILDVFEKAFEQEKEVTKSINNIVGSSLKENDFATYAFFQWFVSEQVEEESNMRTMIQKLKMIGDNSSAMYLMNEELGKRVFVTAP